jgi:class 3 adenylate cyclase/tetratricopeptide (TPR) repeat protein
VQACPQCGEENPERARFCLSCGAPLTAPEPTREERKRVSVLFADLVGFTSRAEQLDPEEVRALQSPYWARVKSEIERFGGTVEKFIGDAVMALFGAPIAHEDDPERAVRAALSIRDAIGSDEQLHVRVAVTTGEALVSLAARTAEGEGMASGDVVNTASRLQSAAPTNGILVDETTYRATAPAIEYRESDPVQAKGKAEPIVVWEAIEPRWRFGVDVEQRGPAELVGRGEELDVLTDALARARRERASQLVTLVGVPGIGKSRLVYELSHAVEADPDLIYWRQGRSLPYGEGVTLWALGEIVKGHAGILETDAAEGAEQKLRAAVAEAISDPVDIDWVTGHLQPLVGLEGEAEIGGDRRAEVFAAWRKFFEALAERRPLVLVFEDLQWADDGLLDFVDHLVEWASGVPLLCVCTARPELLERRPDWGGGKRNATTISLSPLSETETARLVAALLEQSVLPAEVQATLLSRSGGNPLYAEEYVRMLQDRGFERIADLQLPESVQGIIAARLDALAPEEKDLLQDAAVIGKVIWVGALAQIVDLPRWTVEERLHALERKEFVRREQHSSIAGETEYAFRHILVRDVAYGQIPRSRRADKHRAAAEWMESLGSERGEGRAELLAHHYLSALDYARTAGQDTAELAERGRLALRDAGDRAYSLTAMDAAARFYDAAVELWPEDDPDRPELLLRNAEAWWWTGGRGVAARALEARDSLLTMGKLALAAEAEILLKNVYWYQGEQARAEQHLDAARVLVQDLPPSYSKAHVLSQVARLQMLAGEVEAAIEVGREALRMAEQLDLPSFQAAALNTVGVARANAGDPGGIEDIERAIAIAAAANNNLEHGRGLLNLAVVLGGMGKLDRAFELEQAARDIARSGGDAVGIRWSEGNMLKSLYWRGDWDAALDIAESFIADTESGSVHYMAAQAYYHRAAMRLARGDQGAPVDVTRALELARAAKDPQVLYPTLAFASHLLWASGERTPAKELWEELAETWSKAFFSGLPHVGLAETAWLACALGSEERFLGAFAESTSTPWVEAARAIASGDPLGAADVYAGIGARPEEAFTRLHSRAPAEVGRALAFYRSVGANAHIREGEALLAASA